MNAAGIALIKEFEGCRLTAYRDQVGVLTIGYGHTGDVREGQRISQHQADVVLESDIEYFEARVTALCPGANANQLAAMTSLAYNIGLGNFEKSHLVREFNECDLKGAAIAFGNWRCAGGEVNDGLVARRAAEAALFKEPV